MAVKQPCMSVQEPLRGRIAKMSAETRSVQSATGDTDRFSPLGHQTGPLHHKPPRLPEAIIKYDNMKQTKRVARWPPQTGAALGGAFDPLKCNHVRLHGGDHAHDQLERVCGASIIRLERAAHSEAALVVRWDGGACASRGNVVCDGKVRGRRVCPQAYGSGKSRRPNRRRGKRRKSDLAEVSLAPNSYLSRAPTEPKESAVTKRESSCSLPYSKPSRGRRGHKTRTFTAKGAKALSTPCRGG